MRDDGALDQSGFSGQHKNDFVGILHGVVVVMLVFRNYDDALEVHTRDKIKGGFGSIPRGLRGKACVWVPGVGPETYLVTEVLRVHATTIKRAIAP